MVEPVFAAAVEDVMRLIEPVAAPPEIRDFWPELREAARATAAREPVLAGFLHAAILSHDGVAEALAYHLGQKLSGPDLDAAALREICAEAFRSDGAILRAFDRDMAAVRERDPACRSPLQPFLYYKGLGALQAYRVAHWLWNQDRQTLAFHLQSAVSERFQVDIHPAAVLGSGIFIDHATGIVIGETSVVGDDVSILQSVTLGGTGKERGDRHPKVERGVLISVGAKILGNIRIGREARVAAGSVVLHDVPPCATVAGVPAKIVRGPICPEPAKKMDQFFGDGI
jgi:serine O-acetyltransferase